MIAGVLAIVLAPFGCLFALFYGRVLYERVAVLFRVAEHLAEINRKTREWTRAASPPSRTEEAGAAWSASAGGVVRGTFARSSASARYSSAGLPLQVYPHWLHHVPSGVQESGGLQSVSTASPEHDHHHLQHGCDSSLTLSP
jgi:hypothetical protein